MPISVTCSTCNKKLKVPDAAAGKKVRCPACKAVVMVPVPEEELVAPDDDLVEPDEETAVSEAPPPPKKKAAWDKGSPDESESEGDGNYGIDEKDEDEREERRRDRERKEKKKSRADAKQRRRSYKPHRAGGIMTCAILSFVACIFLPGCLYMAMRAVNMANEDLAEMSSGRMDPSGRGATEAGKYIAIIVAAFSVITTIINAVLIVRGT